MSHLRTCASHSVHQKQDVLLHLSNWPGAVQRRSGALREIMMDREVRIQLAPQTHHICVDNFSLLKGDTISVCCRGRGF